MQAARLACRLDHRVVRITMSSPRFDTSGAETPLPDMPGPASPSSATALSAALVWDAPVRMFHWLLVSMFVGAYLSAEGERWRLLHVTLGYTMAGLVGFRLVWGLVGTRHARFSSFVRGPAAVMRYVRNLLNGHPEHYIGHNPAGALAIMAMLVLALAITATGWAIHEDVGGEWIGDAHELFANTMVAVVLVHVAGVVLASWLHRENLFWSMVTGMKLTPPQDAIGSAWRSVALLLLMAVFAFWWLQWRGAPPAVPAF